MISIDPQAQALVPAAATLSRPTLSRFLTRARTAVGLEGEVELLLTSDAELKRLNRAFRNKNKATDILSFPTPPEIADHHAGDLAISLETAAPGRSVQSRSPGRTPHPHPPRPASSLRLRPRDRLRRDGRTRSRTSHGPQTPGQSHSPSNDEGSPKATWQKASKKVATNFQEPSF